MNDEQRTEHAEDCTCASCDPGRLGFKLPRSQTTDLELDGPAFGSRDYYLAQATTDTHEAWVAVQAGNWLRADLYLKLAIDEIKDAGVLP